MIVSVSIENWMSFRDRAEFSMVATRERQHGQRLAKVQKYQTRLLPVAAVFGGNASGKSNFFKALRFAQELIVRGTQPDSKIAVEPFCLDADVAQRPTRFTFELLIGDDIYTYGFSVTRRQVQEELLAVALRGSEKTLFERREGEITFDKSLEGDAFLEFAFRGTRDNQLFLTNAVSQKVDQFRPVYDWFKSTLYLIAPDARFGSFDCLLDEGHPHYAAMNDLLAGLDTGIAQLKYDKHPVDTLVDQSKVKALMESIEEGGMFIGDDDVILTRENNRIFINTLVACHPRADGAEMPFALEKESDGSQRLIHLLPAFVDLAAPNTRKVYVIDELDRSLHTLLTRQLLEYYLSACSGRTRSQLLFTTHDALLMDQNLLRRDEMWVTERDRSGGTRLIPFSDYKDVRYDKDIRKSYLLGRMGGIPRLLLNRSLAPLVASEDPGEYK